MGKGTIVWKTLEFNKSGTDRLLEAFDAQRGISVCKRQYAAIPEFILPQNPLSLLSLLSSIFFFFLVIHGSPEEVSVF